MSEYTQLKIGIVGTGRIAHRFVPEARTVEDLEIVMVCNPRRESARLFAEELSIPAFTDDIDELTQASDAVYIATPHETHYGYAKYLLERGVHVLCEKPMSFSRQQARELYDLARANGGILLEGIKTAYCPGFQAILEFVKSGKIGAVHDVEACFSRLNSTNARECWDLSYGGSFTEYGTYTLLPVVKLLGCDSIDTHIWSLNGVTGVDTYTKMTVCYADRIATAKTGLGVKSEGQLVIAGTNGYILVPSPWWLTRSFQVRYEDSNRIEQYEAPYVGQGLRYEIREFADCVRTINTAREAVRKGAEKELLSETWEKIMELVSVKPEESIWIAEQMEAFLRQRKTKALPEMDRANLRYWAHRGCSMRYPENTLPAFAAAAEIDGICGIELDTQLTNDGTVVVIHDERVERTTDGTGAVRDLTIDELRRLHITGSRTQDIYVDPSDGSTLTVPTLEEVFALLQPYCKNNHLMINIELKNSVVRYEGMEQKVLDLVEKYDLSECIVYSSFLPESMGLIKVLCPTAQIAILAGNIHDCMDGARTHHADALHPWIGGMDPNTEIYDHDEWKNMPVRAWNGEEPFYGETRLLKERHMEKYQLFGATDIITNVPEEYLRI